MTPLYGLEALRALWASRSFEHHFLMHSMDQVWEYIHDLLTWLLWWTWCAWSTHNIMCPLKLIILPPNICFGCFSFGPLWPASSHLTTSCRWVSFATCQAVALASLYCFSFTATAPLSFWASKCASFVAFAASLPHQHAGFQQWMTCLWWSYHVLCSEFDGHSSCPALS